MMPSFGSLMRVSQRLRQSELLRHTSVSVLDQALNSAANFAVGLLLIRTLPTSEYGVFVLATTALYLSIGVENALVTAPMSVLAPKLTASDKKRFVDNLALTQLVIGASLVLVAAATVVFLGIAGVVEASTLRLVLVTLAAALPFLVRELVRQVLFVFSAPRSVLLIDTVYAVVMLIGVAVVTNSAAPSGVRSMAAIAIAASVAAVVAIVVYVRTIGLPRTLDLRALTPMWRPAFWGLLGMLVSWLQNQGFLYLLAAVQGAEAVGNVSAARLLLTPIALVITGVGSILRPRSAMWLAKGESRQALWRVVVLTLATAAGAFGYVLVLWGGRAWIIEPLLHKPVDSLEALVAVWALVLLIEVFRENLMILLQALERFDILFFLALAGGVSALGGGYVLLQHWGAFGAVAGVALGEAVYLLGICVALARIPALREVARV